MAKKTETKAETQKKLMNPTQLAQVFAKYFDTNSLKEVIKVVGGRTSQQWLKDAIVKTVDTKEGAEFVEFAKGVDYALDNPNAPEVQDFKGFLEFVIQFKQAVDGVYHMSDIYAKSYLTQLEELVTDSQAKFSLMKRFSSVRIYDPNVKTLLISLLAKNADKTSMSDWEDVLSNMQGREDLETVFALFEQLENVFVQEVQTELGKKPYDINKIQARCNDLRRVVSLIGRMAWYNNDRTAVDKWAADILGKYELEKILGSTMEQISELPKAGYVAAHQMESEVAGLCAEISKLKSQLSAQDDEKTAEINRLNRELSAVQQTLADAQGQNQILNRENSALRQGIEELKRTAETTNSKLTALIDGAKKLKSGLGSRGVNDYKAMVDAMQSTAYNPK